MWCSNCPFFADCEDPAQLGGGCDCDGADDFGVDPIDAFDVDPIDDFDVDPIDELRFIAAKKAEIAKAKAKEVK